MTSSSKQCIERENNSRMPCLRKLAISAIWLRRCWFHRCFACSIERVQFWLIETAVIRAPPRGPYCIVSLSFYWSILQDPTTLLFVVILLPYNYFTTRSRGSSRGLPSVPLPNSLTRLGLTRAKVSHSGDRTVTSSSELGLNPGPWGWQSPF